MEPDELEYLAHAASRSKRIVEIGSWRGRSARVLADHTVGVVFCVDTWDDSGIGIDGWWNSSDSPALHMEYGWLWKQFYANLQDHILTNKVIPILGTSLEGTTKVTKCCDMIFIDASHDYESVKQDIL